MPFRRRPRSREIDDEIRAHLEIAIRERVARGEDPQSAERAARRELGNPTLTHEAMREVWGWTWMEQLFQDIRYGVRGMRASPAFTAVAVLSLALGIGANTAIFSILYTAMLRALPVAQPEQLVEFLQKYPGEPRGNGYWSWRSYEHYRDRTRSFSALTAAGFDRRARVDAEGSESTFVTAETVLGNYFSTLGVKPALGRSIGPDDQAENPVAVISWDLWTSRFHRNPAILGKRIAVNDRPAVIVGVAARGYRGLLINLPTDVWLPVSRNAGLALIARLKPDVTIEQARAEMAALYRFTIEERAARSKDPLVRKLQVEVEPCGAGLNYLRDRVGKPLNILMAVVAVLLALACVNIAGLLLARGAARAREMAVRLGLGASRARLARQMLTESVLLSITGAAAGTLVAYHGTTFLLRLIDSGREHERVHLQVTPDAGILLFTAATAILTGLLFGLAPAWNAFRSSPASALRGSGGAVETRGSRRLGRALVAAQVALSVLLLAGASLFVGHLAELRGADLGFQRDEVLLVALDPSRSGHRGERLVTLYRDLLDRVSALPGVSNVSLSAPTPLQGAGASGFATTEGFQERPEDRRRVSITYVAPAYFETLGVPLLAGRQFTFHDLSNPRIAIINASLRRRYFAGRDPIGRTITLDQVTLAREPAAYEIVGVAGDAHYLEIREPAQPALYLPAFRQDRVIAHTVAIRSAVAPATLLAGVKDALRSAAPGVEVNRVITLGDQVDASILLERVLAHLSGFFAAAGALLAGIGLYGLLAFTVARRTGEIGVRIALGASPGGIARMIGRDACLTVAAGLALGLPLAFAARRLASTLIHDITRPALWAFVAAAAALAAVSLLASYLPARRAARINPVDCLRRE